MLETMTVWGAHWIGWYAHDPTKLFAGDCQPSATGLWHLSLSGACGHDLFLGAVAAYSSAGERVEEPGKTAEDMEAETALIAITYGYSRDHRERISSSG